MNGYAIPKATLGRLPQYLKYLRNLPPEQHSTISATAIAKGLSLGEVQVRKDLASVSGSGKPKIGYVTADLIQNIEACLGTGHYTSAILIGAGKLGRALLDYNGFEEYGVKIVAAFDCDEKKTNLLNSIPVLPLTQLEEFCLSQQIRLGIITADKEAAQDLCNRMVSCGIKGIWSFAPCKLSVPEHISLHSENLALSLAHLNQQLG